MKFEDFLFIKHACPDAINFAKNKSIKEAWNMCPDGSWIFWLCEQMINEPGWPTTQDILKARYMATVDIVLSYSEDESFELNYKTLTAMLVYAENPNEYTAKIWKDLQEEVDNNYWTHFEDDLIPFILSGSGAWNPIDEAVTAIATDTHFSVEESKEVRKYIADIAREHLWYGKIKDIPLRRK